jgi:hypothetical protein
LQLAEASSPLNESDTQAQKEWAANFTSMPEASKLAVRLHLLALLFEVKVCTFSVLLINMI